MSVIVKRKGSEYIAELPYVPSKGSWSITSFHGRIIAAHPGHPPIILGLDGKGWEKLLLGAVA